MVFFLGFVLWTFPIFSISFATLQEKPNSLDPVSYICEEGEFVIQTRRNFSEANRARPGDWKTACDNEKLVLDCGKGNAVRIIDVEYGRSDGSTCHNYPFFFLSCSSNNAYHKVHQRCDNKEWCTITANSDEFGDPCPGIIKYLKVKHRCEPVSADSLESITVCENENKNLTCPKGTSLMITNVFYGRNDTTTCPHINVSNTTCKAENALDVLSAKCDHMRLCDLSSAKSLFGDPCDGTSKYLSVKYQCIVDDVEYATACEGGVMEIECKNNSYINVIRAEYGRGHPYICNSSPNPILPKGCSSPNEINIVYGRCQGKSSCSITATSDVFGEPCEKIPKYLELDYICGERWDPEDSPGAPIIKEVDKNSIRFTSEKLNKLTSKLYKVQKKGVNEELWKDVLDGETGLDLSEVQTLGGLSPDEQVDVRIVKNKTELSACIPFTRVRTRT